ncbi:MAG: GNAT family N-acetyltransferase [Acutalibacteraceae bacterium]
MLNIVTQIDENTISRLMSVYSESMNDMRINFADDAQMCAAYASFLREFVKSPKQLIIVETFDDEWVSALRAIETIKGYWFLEAVETKPEERKKGFGKDLLHHTIDYLKSIGMTELTCIISKNNFKSQALHEKCGFIPTNELPLNCWGELEEGCILYRLVK